MEASSIGDGTLEAKAAIRRGALVFSATPVLLVNKKLFDEDKDKDAAVPAAEQSRLLAMAMEALPAATRRGFGDVGDGSDGSRTIKQLLHSQPFHLQPGRLAPRGLPGARRGLGLAQARLPAQRRRLLRQRARAARARHAQDGARRDADHLQRAAAVLARRAPKGLRKLHTDAGGYSKCSCRHCTGGGDLLELNKADARLESIAALDKHLKDAESPDVTPAMIERYLGLFRDDRLDSQLSGAYWLAALNYNYLGDVAAATRYATRAIQAAITEGGDEDNNDVVERRIMLADPKGHYSYRFKIIKGFVPAQDQKKA